MKGAVTVSAKPAPEQTKISVLRGVEAFTYVVPGFVDVKSVPSIRGHRAVLGWAVAGHVFASSTMRISSAVRP
jgi:hypothetical protein